jgi:hypothetical protein
VPPRLQFIDRNGILTVEMQRVIRYLSMIFAGLVFLTLLAQQSFGLNVEDST